MTSCDKIVFHRPPRPISRQ